MGFNYEIWNSKITSGHVVLKGKVKSVREEEPMISNSKVRSSLFNLDTYRNMENLCGA